MTRAEWIALGLDPDFDSHNLDIFQVGVFSPNLKADMTGQWSEWLAAHIQGEPKRWSWGAMEHPHVRDPQEGIRLAQMNLGDRNSHMVWHHDSSEYSNRRGADMWMAVWADKYPTLIRKMNHRTEVPLKAGVVYLFNNQRLEHKTPPEAATEERWLARMYYQPGAISFRYSAPA